MTPATLPRYSGPDPQCPKCGHKGASTEFLSHGKCIHGVGATIIGLHPNERLHRECQCCSFAWDEATVEQPTTDRDARRTP